MHLPGTSNGAARRRGRLFARGGVRSALLLAFAVLLVAPAAAAPPRSYYLSLRDSLAVGMQPDGSGHNRATNQGYVDALGRRLAAGVPELTLTKAGCPGETTWSMLSGGLCRYAGGSQLGQAEAFLRRHRDSVALVTVDIGDNDVERCVGRGGSIDGTCVQSGLAAIRANLPVIVARLRAAAAPGVPVVGVTDYDQFLAFWLHGRSGHAIARATVDLVGGLNQTMDSIYAAAGVVVADAAPRFATADLDHLATLHGYGRVPRAVARICGWTWACSGSPIGMNDHANSTGYAQIADTIQASLLPVAPRLFASTAAARRGSPSPAPRPSGGVSAGG